MRSKESPTRSGVASVMKRSDAFRRHVPDDVPNFTAYPRGTIITEDGAERYVVAHPEERIVLPNRGVRNGLRAGLMWAKPVPETLALRMRHDEHAATLFDRPAT